MPTERFYRLPEAKKQVIRQAAIKEFARVPFEKASINQIIQNADISRGSFYTYFEDKQDLVEPVLPTASSPLPAIVKCKDEEAELDWIVEAAIRMSGNQSIAILVRNRELVDLVEEKLRAKKIIPQILKNRMGVLDLNAKISIGTYHSAKGLEFDMVFLPFCSMKYLPSEERVLANESRDEALKEETKLLYVAITRAKRGLILSYTEEKTELLLEVDTSLYDERELK